MTTRLVTQEVTKSPTRLAAGLPIPLLLMPLQSDLRLLRGTGSATFTRSTIKRYLRKDTGLITVAAVDEPAFEQNGILIEGASTNLLLRSEEFDNAVWGKLNGATITSADSETAPDGTTTADKVDLSFSSVSKIDQDVTGATSASTEHTFAIYARVASGTDTFRLNAFDSGAGNQISGNFAVTTTFQRFEFTFTYGAGAARFCDIRSDAGAASALIIWGAQLEALPFASSYIKTVASTVTKTDEDTDIDAANIPAPTADYTISMEVDAIGFDSSLSQVLFNVAGETSRRIAWNTTTGAIEATHGAVTSVSTSTFSAGDRVKISFVVDATNQTLFINGIQEDQDAKGTVTGTATAINIGHQAGVNQAFSHIKPLRINNVALTAAQVGAL